MIGMISRLFGATLGICFVAWWLYITWLGLKVFFGIDNTTKTTEKNK
jgi:hypothetical protein